MGDKNIQLPDGRVVAFPGTMSDDEIAGAIKANMPSAAQEQLNPAQAANEAYRQNVARAGQEKVQQSFGGRMMAPFQYLNQAWGVGMPRLASVLDALAPTQVISGAGQGVADIARATQEPNLATAAVKGLTGAGEIAMGGLAALHPLGFSQIGAAGNLIGQTSPAAKKAVETVGAPFQNLMSPETPEGQARAKAGDVALGLAAVAGGGLLGKKLQTTASRGEASAMGVGRNFAESERFGKVGQELGLTKTRSGLENASNVAKFLTNEINSKIIDPATQSGVKIQAADYIKSMQDFKTGLENVSVPDQASIRAVDRMIQSATDRAAKSNGEFTPTEAQAMKVYNNKILASVYDKLASSGTMTEQLAAKKAALVEQTNKLRSQLEQIHPELKTLNEQDAAVISIRNAIRDYLDRTARGEGAPAFVGRGGFGRAMTLSVYDLFHVDPIRTRIAVALGRAGRALTGELPQGLKRVENPFNAEAPTSRGGSMSVRGGANQAQIDKFYREGRITEEQARQWGVSPALLRNR